MIETWRVTLCNVTCNRGCAACSVYVSYFARSVVSIEHNICIEWW